MTSLGTATPDLHLLLAAVVGVLVVVAVVLTERAAHRREARARRAQRAAHDARLRALDPAQVDAAFDRLVARHR